MQQVTVLQSEQRCLTLLGRRNHNLCMECLNCLKELEGPYCLQCGQSAKVKRLAFVAVVSDYFANITNTERGFLRTVGELAFQPGKMTKAYIQGKRVKYVSAVKLSLVAIVLCTVILNLLEYRFGMFETMTKTLQAIETHQSEDDDAIVITQQDVLEAAKGAKDKPALKTEVQKKGIFKEKNKIKIDFFGQKKSATKEQVIAFTTAMIPAYHRLLFDFLQIIGLSWVPIFSILSFLFFRKAKLNLAEHLTFNSFVFAELIFIFALLSPFYFIVPERGGEIFMLTLGLQILYLMISYLQFFAEQSKRLFRSILVISFGVSAYLFFASSALTALAIYLVYSNLSQLAS